MNSPLIEQLKNVKETIDKNYSSHQLYSVLDGLLYRTIEPLITYTNFFDTVLANLMSWYCDDSRRKVSTIDKGLLYKLIYIYLLSTDPKVKLRLVKKMQLERNVIFSTISLFLNITDNYNNLFVDKISSKVENQDLRRKLNKIETTVQAKETLFVCINNTKFWIKQANAFKNNMMEKYMRSVVNKAMSYKTATSAPILLDDLCQNFLLSVSKAIDKFDVNQGTLTSYINHWIRSAQLTSTFGHEVGIAFKVSQEHRKNLAMGNGGIRNIAVSLDIEEVTTAVTPGPEEILEKEYEITHIRKLAKFADPIGLARAELEIAEVLSEKEINIQKSVVFKC